VTHVHALIGFCWFLVVVIWLVTAAETKKSTKDAQGKVGRWIRFFFFVGFLACLGVKDIRALNDIYLFSPNYFVQAISVVLCIVGVCFAIWARLRMGRNWSMPMTVKEHSRLVTSGPYALVRHPIYAGLCLALVGSILTAGLLWAFWYSVWTLYFLYSAVKEEKTMLMQFPDEYAKYQERTRMLIPFVL
jgi:protein-S-isoprenylcysteine O-methyltransferase Ste14